VFPGVLKISRVIPVDAKLQAYIDSISVLKNRLVDFVDRHAIFYARQYGNSNTEAALFDFVAHTQQLVERKWKVLSTAFDTVNIEILLTKLAAIGILGDEKTVPE
jgi:hypothetical protein